MTRTLIFTQHIDDPRFSPIINELVQPIHAVNRLPPNPAVPVGDLAPALAKCTIFNMTRFRVTGITKAEAT